MHGFIDAEQFFLYDTSECMVMDEI